MNEEPSNPGGSWALQGCLFGAVALFVVLLLVMIFLAFQRFREHTAPSTPVPVDTVQIPNATPSFVQAARIASMNRWIEETAQEHRA